MGWELHIARTVLHWEAARYPILESDVRALVSATPELSYEPRGPQLVWDDLALWFEDGALSVKHPSDVEIRRMVSIAKGLDAWLTGDDPEIFGVGIDGAIVSRQPTDKEIRFHDDLHLVRPSAPISAAEWQELVDATPDLAWQSTVDALLPGGLRSIPCDPMVVWTRHPVSRQVPLFHDDGTVLIRCTDRATVFRATALAGLLVADLQDDNFQSLLTESV